MSTVKINQLEIENVKRVKAVQINPTQNGLTIIGGKNSQGKTSVLDSIAWVLGGDRYKPSNPGREGSVTPPNLHIELSNGIIVERKGENSNLKVIDANGNRGGQQLLNEFIGQLALNLPKFMNQSNKEKADTLLQIIGIGDIVYQLESEEQTLYNKRHAIGQIAEQKSKHAQEMVYYHNVPNDLVSISDLIIEQQNILARNGENQRKRKNVKDIQSKYEAITSRIMSLKAELADLTKTKDSLLLDLETASKTAEQLVDESTAEIEKSILDIERTNNMVRSNLEREKAVSEAEQYKIEYDELTERIRTVRQKKTDLLNGADLPLPGLSVEGGELIYNGFKWDNMSSSEQLKVATAIVRKINPKCGFVLIDKLEQMDIDTLDEFGKWLESEGLQAIATRVSTGDECSIIIEDGYVKPSESKTWKAGSF